MYVQWVDSIVLSTPPTPSSLGWSISFHFLLGSRAFCHKPLREEKHCYGLSCSGEEKTIIKFFKLIFLATFCLGFIKFSYSFEMKKVFKTKVLNLTSLDCPKFDLSVQMSNKDI